MTISIGRLVDLPNPSDLEVRRGAVSLGGYVTGASVAEGLAYRDEFAYLAETDAPIPVVYSSDSSIDGFYRVMASQSNLHMQTPTTALVYWSVDLISVGERFQSKLTQLTRANDLGYTENDLAFVGLPVGAYGFVPGTTTARTRTTAAGDTIVHQVAQYGGGSGAVAPSWGCAPADYLKGACKITTGGYVRVSRVSPNTPASFILENELVRVTEGASGAIDVEHYDGTAWRSLTYTFS